MNIAPPSGFRTNFLRLCSGPLIWAAHFLAVYAFTGILCARPAMQKEWLGVNVATWSVFLAAVVALAAIASLQLRWRRLLKDGQTRFIHRVALGLALLSALAIIWETVPAMLIQGCQ
jgi:hypothetical protein